MKAEDFYTLVEKRQSDRKFDPDRPIPQEVIDRIINAGRLSPSACNSQPWSFIVVTDPETRTRLAEASSSRLLGMNHFTRQAPVQIIIVEEKANFTATIGGKMKGIHYANIDLGIAAAHITLAATAEGLGSCIIGWVNDKKIREILDIPSNRRVVMNIMLGYSIDPHRPKKRKETSEILHKEKW